MLRTESPFPVRILSGAIVILIPLGFHHSTNRETSLKNSGTLALNTGHIEKVVLSDFCIVPNEKKVVLSGFLSSGTQ